MIGILKKLRRRSLFFNIFVVMVIGISSVSFLTSMISIQMSEDLFMNTFSITNNKIMDQIQTNFETFNSSMLATADEVTHNGSIKAFLTSGESDSLTTHTIYYNMMQQMKSAISTSSAYDVSISILGQNGSSYFHNRPHWSLTTEELAASEITARALSEPKRLHYQFNAEYNESKPTDMSVIVASKALSDRVTGDIYGVMHIAMRENDFRETYVSFTTTGNDVAIIDQEGTVVSSNRMELIGEQGRELLVYAKQLEEGKYLDLKTDFMDKEQILLATYIPNFDFYLINMIDKDLVLSQMIDVKKIVFISVLIAVVAIIIVFVMTRKQTKSLSRLVKQMSNITKKKFGNYIKIEGSYETRELGQAYNYMLDELQDYITKLTETQISQRNAELAALQMQINPHFLYNTLASIKILVMQGSKEKASDTINSLISLLQHTIGSVGEMVSIDVEMLSMRNYAQINHVRYGERIKMNYFVSPNCKEYKLPKLILQPFIENAFFHAFNVKREGYIYVLISQEEDVLICEVVDNGDGIDEVTKADGLPSPKGSRQLFSGIGIRNVHERILLLYGKEYGVTISSKSGEGTRVKIKLPLIP